MTDKEEEKMLGREIESDRKRNERKREREMTGRKIKKEMNG